MYSFLDYMLDSGRRSGPSKNVVDRHRLEVSGDDMMILESFTRELPHIFENIESASPLKNSYGCSLLVLSSSNHWKDPRLSRGLGDHKKIQILRNISIPILVPDYRVFQSEWKWGTCVLMQQWYLSLR